MPDSWTHRGQPTATKCTYLLRASCQAKAAAQEPRPPSPLRRWRAGGGGRGGQAVARDFSAMLKVRVPRGQPDPQVPPSSTRDRRQHDPGELRARRDVLCGPHAAATARRGGRRGPRHAPSPQPLMACRSGPSAPTFASLWHPWPPVAAQARPWTCGACTSSSCPTRATCQRSSRGRQPWCARRPPWPRPRCYRHPCRLHLVPTVTKPRSLPGRP